MAIGWCTREMEVFWNFSRWKIARATDSRPPCLCKHTERIVRASEVRLCRSSWRSWSSLSCVFVVYVLRSRSVGFLSSSRGVNWPFSRISIREAGWPIFESIGNEFGKLSTYCRFFFLWQLSLVTWCVFCPQKSRADFWLLLLVDVPDTELWALDTALFVVPCYVNN